MSSTTSASDVLNTIQRLRRERQEHLRRVAEIDALFARIGVSAEPGSPLTQSAVGRQLPGKPAGVAARGRERHGDGSRGEPRPRLIDEVPDRYPRAAPTRPSPMVDDVSGAATT